MIIGWMCCFFLIALEAHPKRADVTLPQECFVTMLCHIHGVFGKVPKIIIDSAYDES